MEIKRKKSRMKKAVKNHRRDAVSFAEVLSAANRRAHEQANTRRGQRGLKSVHAAIHAEDIEDELLSADFLKRLLRWSLGLAMLPLCWVTTWTFLARFSHATLYQGFWQTTEFWYFATGALVMAGWFWTGLLQTMFLYLYVLGHELTHAVFVLLHRGKVTSFHVSSSGGYITTTKTNLIIALSPYFVPFWAVIFAVLFGVARYFGDFSTAWDGVLYGGMGFTWTFHMLWTVWMIPRDQPDLKENGTFLSLVIIYLANLLILIALLCVAAETPWQDAKEFWMEWIRNAATAADRVWRTLEQGVFAFKQAGRF